MDLSKISLPAPIAKILEQDLSRITQAEIDAAIKAKSSGPFPSDTCYSLQKLAEEGQKFAGLHQKLVEPLAISTSLITEIADQPAIYQSYRDLVFEFFHAEITKGAQQSMRKNHPWMVGMDIHIWVFDEWQIGCQIDLRKFVQEEMQRRN